MLEKTLDSPLDSCKEIKPVHPKGDHSWVFIAKTDVEAETLTLMLGKIEGNRRRGQQRMRWLDSIATGWAGLGRQGQPTEGRQAGEEK